MPGSSQFGAAPEPASGKERRLESWGEIASYLRREIRTVQRWEKTLDLPIHRLKVGKNSSVYAYPSELDKWYLEREPKELKDDEPTDISSSSLAPEPAAPDISPAPDESNVGDARPPATISPNKRRSAWLAGMALLILSVWLAVRFDLLVSLFHPTNPTVASGKLRLFVRPFQTVAGDQGQIEFTDGLTSEINTRLGKLDPARLGVIAPTSSKRLGDKPISELEQLLKLNYVLEGSVRRANEKVRIDISLISAKDQTPLWSDSYTENVSDILKVQDKVADAVAENLVINLPPAAAAVSSATVDPAGYNSYLRGRRYWAVRDLAHGVPEFQAAVQRLPLYVPAHAGLAASYALMGEAPNDAVPQSVSVPRARAEVQQALALDPSNAEAHYVLGNILMSYDWDFPEAEHQLREAIRLEPNNPTAHQWLGQYYMTQNRLADARVETGKALDLDPVSPIFTTALAETAYYAHDFDTTITQAKLTLEQSPHFLLGEYWLASAYREKKMYPQAEEHFRAACKLAPDNPALMTVLAHALAVSGDRPGALAILAQLQTLSHQRYVPALYVAGVYVGLRDFNNAFLYLNRAVAERDDRLAYLAVEPMADPMHSDPRFQALLVRLNLNNLKH